MTLHVGFIRNGCTDYTFIDCHTSEEIAFGSYTNEGDFLMISHCDGVINKYVSAAVAFCQLQLQLKEHYGY